MNIVEEIERLALYGINKNIIDEIDKTLIINRIIDILQLEEYESLDSERIEELKKEIENVEYPCDILDNITKWAGENNRLQENILVFHDILNAKIMGQIIPLTSSITKKFWEKYQENKELATNYFYNLSRQSNYIRTDRIAKNISYNYKSNYGNLEITINLSKPEKDPKEIALARNISNAKYPKSLLCKENEGYMGRINHPARQNHRIIKLNLTNEDWYFQYSPYIYYNEHSIVFSSEIRPMKIDRGTFDRLLEFTSKFPHYFIGSNADIPIVGGSILSHDHFQAGRHKFAMDDAEVIKTIKYEAYNDIDVEILKWPLSVVRLKGNNKENILNLSEELLNKWINYTDYESNILAYTDNVRHNSITPIARIRNGIYELDLVFRNNRTTDQYPLGIFHPHEEYHSIKKENIGLIEVMGLAVLPGRLEEEMTLLKNIADKSKNKQEVLDKISKHEQLNKHIKWFNNNFENSSITEEDIRNAIGKTFEKVLEDCGVFKNLERFEKFLNS